MKTYIIVLYSYTAARKASRKLSMLGIKSGIEKISSYKGGCGYGIRVSEAPEKICRLLSESGIRCKEVITRG